LDIHRRLVIVSLLAACFLVGSTSIAAAGSKRYRTSYWVHVLLELWPEKATVTSVQRDLREGVPFRGTEGCDGRRYHWELRNRTGAVATCSPFDGPVFRWDKWDPVTKRLRGGTRYLDRGPYSISLPDLRDAATLAVFRHGPTGRVLLLEVPLAELRRRLAKQ
jgi:hypothetical protein